MSKHNRSPDTTEVDPLERAVREGQNGPPGTGLDSQDGVSSLDGSVNPARVTVDPLRVKRQPPTETPSIRGIPVKSEGEDQD